MNLNPDFLIESFEQNHDVRIYYNFDPMVYAWRFHMKKAKPTPGKTEGVIVNGGLADSQWNSPSGPEYLLKVLMKMYQELAEKED